MAGRLFLFLHDFSLNLMARAGFSVAEIFSLFRRVRAKRRGWQAVFVEQRCLGIVRPVVAHNGWLFDALTADDNGRAVNFGLGVDEFSVSSSNSESSELVAVLCKTTTDMVEL
jgi:hypothetical protein